MITNNEEGDSESNHYYGNISEPDDYPELYNRPFIDVNSFNFSSSSTKMKSSSIKTTIKTKSNNLKMSDKRTPLHHACLSNNVHDVQQLIASHAPLDEKDELCRTPLHLACWQRHCNIARILIQAGADFNALDIRNNTPMHLICFGHWLTAHKCYVKLVLFLIDCGADLEVINKDGHYPLDFVPDLERRKLIKKYFADSARRKNNATNNEEHEQHPIDNHTAASAGIEHEFDDSGGFDGGYDGGFDAVSSDDTHVAFTVTNSNPPSESSVTSNNHERSMKSYWSFILLLVVIVFATSVHPSTRPNRIPSVTVPKETPIAVGTSSEYTTELSPERADIDFTAQLVSPIKDESAKKVVEDFVSVAATTDDINPLLSEPIASPTDDQPAIEISNFDIPALNDFIVIQELRGIAFLFITITMLLLAVIYHSQIQIHRFAYMLRRLRVPRVMPDATVTELPVIRNDADGSHIHNLLATILSLIPGYFKCIQLVSDGNSVYEVFAKSRQDKIRMLARYGHLRRRPHIGQHRTKDSYSDVKLTYRPVWAISPRASVREQRIRISKSRQNESFRNHILKPLTKVKDTIIEIDEAAVPVVVPIKRPIAVCQSPVVDSEQQQEWMQEVSHEHDSEVDNKSDDDHERSFDSKLDTPILTAIAEPQHAPRKKSVTDITTEGDAAKAAERRPQKSQLLTPPLKKRQLFAQAPGAFKIYEEPVHSQLPPGTGAPFQARALLNGPNRDIENLQTAGVVQEPVKRLQSSRAALANVNNNTVRTTTTALQLQPFNKSINVPTGIEPLRKHLVQTAAMELRLSKELTTFVQEDVPTSVAKSQIKNVDDSNVEHHIRHAIINRSLHEDMRKYDR